MHELDYVRPAQKGYYGLSSRSSYTAGVRTCYPQRGGEYLVQMNKQHGTLFKYSRTKHIFYCCTARLPLKWQWSRLRRQWWQKCKYSTKKRLQTQRIIFIMSVIFAAVITTAKKIPTSRKIPSYWNNITKLELPILQLLPVPDPGNFNLIVYQLI